MKNGFIFHEFEELMQNYVEAPKDYLYSCKPESIIAYGENAKKYNTMINELHSKVINEHRWPTTDEYDSAENYREVVKANTRKMLGLLSKFLYDDKTFEYVHQVLKEVESNYFDEVEEDDYI